MLNYAHAGIVCHFGPLASEALIPRNKTPWALYWTVIVSRGISIGFLTESFCCLL